MKLFGNKNTIAFGLDISDSSAKVMQLKPTPVKGNWAVQASASVSLADKTLNNHMIVSADKLAAAIKQAVILAKNINTPYVVCSIPEAKSFVRVLTLPKMPEEEIEGSLPYELEQDIPLPVDQVYLDWQILREVGDKLEVLAVATSKDYIDALVDALHQANLRPVAMELESQATARALIGSELAPETILIVDMGSQQTTFIIIDKGVIEYTSSIPIGGNAFTESIARNLGITPQAGEKLKREQGLTSEDHKGEVRTAVLPILDNVIDETKNVIRFFEEHDATKRRIKHIVLCGGSAQMIGIGDYMDTRINLGSTQEAVTVKMGQPHLDGEFKDAISYATAAGLAIRGVQNETN